MKKMIWFTTLVITFIVFVVPAILGLLLQSTPAGEQPGYDGSTKLSIYGKRDVVQRFVSKEDNLTAIGTSIKNPNLNNKKEIKLDLHDETGNLVRSVSLSGRNVQDGDFIRITFDPIRGSENKTYTFTLSSPTADPEDEIEVFAIKSPTETILDYTYDNQTHPGGIPLVTYHKPDSRWQVVREIYSNWLFRVI